MQGRMLILALLLALSACSHKPSKAPAARTPSSELALLSDKEIETLPVRTFQSGNETADNQSLLRLWKDVGLDNGAEFLDYLNLLPREFRLLDKRQTQALNDRVLLKIFASETGRRNLCFLASNGTKTLRAYLALSKAAAKSVESICQDRNRHLTDAEKHMFYLMYQSFLGQSGQHPKKMIFLLNEGAPPEIEAFTTRRNTSLFILPRNDFTEERLVRMLAHELAMSYDQFTWIGDEMHQDTWQTGMGVIYGLPFFDPDHPGNNSTYFKEGPAPKIRCALYDLPLRYALATERAFRFEDRVASDLGISQGDLGGAHLSCEENIHRWLPFFPRFQPMLSFELDSATIHLEAECGEVLDGIPVSKRNAALMAEVAREGGKALKDLPASKRKEYLERRKKAYIEDSHEHGRVYKRIQDRLVDLKNSERQKFLSERIATLRETELEPKDGSAPVNLCHLLQEPHVGPRYPNFFYGGPRPRAGGWQIKDGE